MNRLQFRGDLWSQIRRCLMTPLVMSVAFLMPAVSAQDGSTQAEAPQPKSQQHLILVIGAPGTDEYRTHFETWAGRWIEAAQRAGLPFTVIGKNRSENSEPAAQAGTPKDAAAPTSTETNTTPVLPPESDAAVLMKSIESISGAKSSEPLWIVYLGHGTFDGRTASLNLQGPDITADQLAAVCQKSQRPLATLICSSCSAPFINALSGPDRIVVTATKDGNQIQYSRFGDALSTAISTLEGDINRDGQTSLLEAWLFASRRTAEFYKTEGRLATEHSLLDDNGDGKGVRSELYAGDRIVENAEDPSLIDGRNAARWHFVRSDEERRLNPEQREKRDELEKQLEDLRKQKGKLSEDDYLKQVENIVVQLAEIYEAAAK